MGWFVVFAVLISVFFAGFSFKSLLLYVIFASVSFGLTRFFLTNKWGLDGLFEELFKIVELFGFGAPHRLENRISYSSFYTNGGLRSLNEIPKPLEECFKKLIENITRDFICTWYRNVGEDERFISEARESLEMLCLEGYKRASQIDSHYMIEQVIVVFHGHLERFNKAMAVVKAIDPKLRLSISSSQLLCQTYKSLVSEPPSLSKPAAELNYLRNVIDSLLVAMIPQDTFSCNTGRFILREILAVQVVEPLVGLLTDPDWIGEAAIDILSDDDKGKVNNVQVVGDSVVVKESDNLDYVVEPTLSEEIHARSVEENSTTVAAQAKPQKEETVKILRKESMEDVGERIEIMSPGHCGESSDFRWSVTSQRQPPVGESQHDNAESFLVISVDESGENSMEECSPNGRNWSTEVVPPSSVDNLTSISLSSSWGVCPSSQDESFNTQSFEHMKSNLPKVEGNVDVGSKLVELGHSLKELTCCHKFEESGDNYRPMSMVAERGSSDEGSDIEEICPRLRTRSQSLPGCDEMFEDKSSLHPCHSELSRSVSVPTKLSFADFDEQEIQEFSTSASPRRFYPSPLYNTSFGSSTDSFKSISSEEDLLDSYIERGEEAVEHCEDFDSYRFGSHWAGTRQRITKQASFEDSNDKQTYNSPTEDSTGSKDTSSPFNKDKFRAEKITFQSKKDSPELDDIRESSWEAAEKDYPDEDAVSRRKRLCQGFGAQNTESFSDAVITAGKKFVSNFKPPFKFDSLSSNSNGSGKSTEGSTTSEGESLDHSSTTQKKLTPMRKSLDAGGARAATFGGRKLSRSDAMIEESIDSDGETCYGTPQGELAQAVMKVGNAEETADDTKLRRVKRMHPSQLISIPSTVIALETTWEPGRNKYTLYKIEYDIRIWHEVYSAAIRQAKHEAKQEKMKRKLYARESQPEDEDVSLEAIKRSVAVKRMICRRYREFMELHNRLTAGNLGSHMKDILRPNRKYNLPFGRLDPHVVEGRRELLQYYLGSLICKAPLRDSDDLKQFLGVTGGEQVSFIKPSVAQIVSQSVHVPRVDKMLSRQMTKVIDTIKTAFDSAEEEQGTPEDFSTAASENVLLPWKLAYREDVPDGDSDFSQDNSLTPFYYSAFLGNQAEFNPPTPPSPFHSLSEEKQENGDEQDGLKKMWKHRVMPSDSEDEAVGWDTNHQVRQSLGPRTAGDGSDNPDDPVALSPDDQSASALHSGFHQRGRSGALLKKHKDTLLSSTPAVAHKSLGLSLSQPAPGSKSMEGITMAASSSKFQFNPQKILEAAKRIRSKSESAEALDALSTVKEKKQGTLRKFLKEKRKIVPLDSGAAPSTRQLPLHPEDPCTVSEMDQPSDLQDESLLDRASIGSDIQCPLSDAILTLLCELLKERGSWLTMDRVQQAFTAALGGLFEWHVQSGIDDITSEDKWAMYLDKLNEAIWPGGKLQEGSEKPKTEVEKAKTRKEAAQALMDAFPGFIMLLFGPRVYHQTAVNVVDSLQYPQINKILLYTLLELLLSEFVPEIHDTLQFYKRITTQM